LENLIWTALGYTSMPIIFIVGFAATAILTCMAMDVLEVESITE